LEILEYTGLKALGITAKACERYLVPQVKTRFGIKLGAVFSESCTKILNPDGGYFWEGDYDPNYGLFGQKAVPPKAPVVLCASDLEALKLASLGVPAVCLAEPKQTDIITFSILADNLALVADAIHVWQASSFGKRAKAMEKFLLYLAGTGRFKLQELLGSADCRVLAVGDEDIHKVFLPQELRPWKPSSIVHPSDLTSSKDFLEPKVGYKTGIAALDKGNGGVRTGEITMFCSGTGCGKTTGIVEILYHMVFVDDVKCGGVFLEEQAKDTLMRLAALYFDIPVSDLRANPSLVSQKQWDAFNNHPKLKKNLVLYNHFGSLDSDELFNKMDYMVDFELCKFIFLDHISIAVSGLSSKEGERKDIDILMTRLASMVVAKDVGVLAITHLNVPEGKAHEEGARVTLSHLRGSGSIKQLSFSIIAFERNQQDPDSTRVLVRQLKGRWNGGATGPIGVLNYDRKTGRLKDDFSWTPEEFEKQLQRAGAQGRGKSGYGPAQPGQGRMNFVDPY
jgi:hypothetical protein